MNADEDARSAGQTTPAGSAPLPPLLLRAAPVASDRDRDDWNRDQKGRGWRAETPRRRGQVSRRTKCANESFAHAGSLSQEECSAVKRSHRAAGGTKRT